MRINDVKSLIRQDRSLMFETANQRRSFNNTVQGIMERSAPNRAYSHYPYYFHGVKHGVYRLLEEGHARLNSLHAENVEEERQLEQQERNRREAERRSFLQSRTEPPNLPDPVEFNGRRFVRDRSFTTRLKKIYGNSCQVCGSAIATFESVFDDNRGYAEVHHIRPLGSGHQGPDYPPNMLVLCPNHHAYFDLGTMALNPESLEVYCLELDGELHNKGGLTWVEPGHQFDSECLQYVWGLFRRKLVDHGVDISDAEPD
ncbi:MAG: hypothetical protein BZY80_07165 [SAR202 cluster bacterium Io17-Chloro-G2]|nr:MAG: hypothetical protein BZY80_07165 [SAR202 cluster bacterium Io17-Chloro-G2]